MGYGIDRYKKLHNLNLIDKKYLDKKGYPIIKKEEIDKIEGVIGFNELKNNKEYNKGIHFYLDDYQFERFWNNPNKYIENIRKYKFVLSPDFSIIEDVNIPLNEYNIFRNRLLGVYMQINGIKVIPTIRLYGKNYKNGLNGLEKGGIYSLSTIRYVKRPEVFKKIIKIVEKSLKPKNLIIYGTKIDVGDYIYLENDNLLRLKDI